MTFLKELQDTKKHINHKWHPHNADVPLLSLKNVGVTYESGYALRDATFDVEQGERVAIVGPNGAGKSTLLKCIAGVLTPTQGTIAISGQKPDEHICIAYLPQKSTVDWQFPVTVWDVVMMGRTGRIGLFKHPTEKDKAIVFDALKTVRMDHLMKRQISQLSGGQQQRMFIARALAQEAELVLMDEPLTGLDTTTIDTIFSILDDLKKEDVTVLVTLHDLNMASEKFEKILLLNRDMIAYGLPDHALSSNHLTMAYGNHMHVVLDDEQHPTMTINDTCCGGHSHD
jgi:manganese/iron transport system ATP-binding protein